MTLIAVSRNARVTDYLESIRRAGGEPIEVGADGESAADIVARVGGVMLVGGGDVDPVLYGEAPHATFKSAEDLRRIYEGEAGLKPADDVIAYCRIGERSSHTWFVLSYLLGYPNVRNYDGSWTEWGNLVGVPIEK